MLSAINVRLRLRTVLLAVLLTLLVVIVACSGNSTPVPDQPVDLVRNRRSFANPIYMKWAKSDRGRKSAQDNCVLYFNEFQSRGVKSEVSSFEDLIAYNFSPLVYKRNKWIAEEKKQYRRHLRLQGIDFDESHIKEVERRYVVETQRLARFEKLFAQETGALRVFGQCFLHMDAPIDDASCVHISRRLLPWLLGKLPSVESWQADVVKEDQARECVVKQIENRLKGRGIVIPLLPKRDAAKQTANVARLIQVLRASQNKLPIEIVYAEEGEISKQRKDYLINVARSLSVRSPPLLKAYLAASDMSSVDFPPQDIRFVNIRPALAKNVPISDTLVWTLAHIFNSFEELVVLSSRTIPLEKLDMLFENPDYKELGTFFFRTRSLPLLKPHKFPTGFFEVNSLVNDYSSVLTEDSKYFKLSRPHLKATLWVRDHGFFHLLDESMVVLNKKKTLAGLLMASSLPFYKFLQPKYDFTGQLNPDCLWLGIEMAGGTPYFNKNFAAAAGVLTPPQNTPDGSMARELCSSSWGQLYEGNDYTLMYVTTHQLDNRVLPDFAPAVIERLTKRTSKAPGVENGNVQTDDSLAVQTVKKNLLYIQSVLQPVMIDQLRFNGNNEPESPWDERDNFGGASDYWCAYDVVGSVNLPDRGIIIDYNDRLVATYLFYLDVWLQAPQSS